LTIHVTAVFDVPVTVAENACDPKVGTATTAECPETTTWTPEPAWIVTEAVAVFVRSENEAAVTFTVAGDGTDVGAMYTPSWEMSP
jgi:hypothetical protein